MEDFVERLLYNVQRAGQMNIGLDVLKIILLWGIRDDCLDMLNLLGKGDISKDDCLDTLFPLYPVMKFIYDLGKL